MSCLQFSFALCVFSVYHEAIFKLRTHYISCVLQIREHTINTCWSSQFLKIPILATKTYTLDTCQEVMLNVY